jgi:hypothetical protein
MQTTPLHIAGGLATWVSDPGAAGDATWLEWSRDGAPTTCVPLAQLRWSTDVLAGADRPGWARTLPTIVQLYDEARSWIFHETRLEPLHDLPGRPNGRWSVHRWASQWVVDYHFHVATPGVSLPLLVALSAVLGSGPSAIR